MDTYYTWAAAFKVLLALVLVASDGELTMLTADFCMASALIDLWQVRINA